MVSSQGFNALLKVVEEPPPHLKFIFATTEPEKVHRDDPVPHPPLPVPAGPAAAAAGLPRQHLCDREERRGRPRRAAAGRARRRGFGP